MYSIYIYKYICMCVYVFSFITLSTYKCYEGYIFFHSVMIKTQNNNEARDSFYQWFLEDLFRSAYQAEILYFVKY